MPVSVYDGVRRAVPQSRNDESNFLICFFALVATITVLGPIIVVATVVRVDSTDPILYWLDRAGRNNRIFRMPTPTVCSSVRSIHDAIRRTASSASPTTGREDGCGPAFLSAESFGVGQQLADQVLAGKGWRAVDRPFDPQSGIVP